MRQVHMPSGRAFIGARLRRSLLVGVGVAAISLALAPGALASTTIGNTPPWTQAAGITSGFGWGTCCSATYGQTVTVPATDTALDSFTFYVDMPMTLTFRGEVYAWDNTVQHATGNALYESGPMHTTSYNMGFGPYEAITFNTGSIPLTAGAPYVLFFTISKDYAANAGITANSFVGVTAADTYSGGNWVFINNFCTTNTTNDCGGDTSLWTTTPWSNNVGVSNGAQDLAFTASFSPPLPTSIAQCMNGGWKTYGVFKNQGDCVSFVASGGRTPA